YRPENQDINAFNKRLVDLVLEDGRVFVSSTSIVGEFWIRIAILSFRTSLETIQSYLSLLQSSINLLKSEKND
ncbi:MAG: amino acid decarboxylase, partial [Saprospiraceae bacterium]